MRPTHFSGIIGKLSRSAIIIGYGGSVMNLGTWVANQSNPDIPQYKVESIGPEIAIDGTLMVTLCPIHVHDGEEIDQMVNDGSKIKLAVGAFPNCHWVACTQQPNFKQPNFNTK